MVHVKKFFEYQSCRGVITSAELLAFKRACTDEEWQYYVTAAESFFKATPA